MAEYSVTFGKCLDQWMTIHDISVAELAELTGTNSGTTISRLRNDQCSLKRCCAFFEQLLALKDIPMSPQEEAKFRAALNVNRMRLGTLNRDEALHDIFFATQGASTSILLQQLKPMLEPAREIHILTFQRASTYLFQDLLSLLKNFGNRIHIHCCLHSVEKGEFARLLADAMSLLVNPRCTMALLPAHTSSPGDLSILRCRTEAGWQEYLLLAQPSKQIRTKALPDSGLYDFFYQVAADATELSYTYNLRDQRSCIRHLEGMYQMEKDAESFLLQEAIPFPMVPVDVLHNAFCMDQGMNENIMELRRISYLRTSNMQSKGKPVHLLLSCEGMKRFMETGELRQGLSPFRSLTREEREATLKFFIEQVRNSENIDFHLSRDESLFAERCIAVHAGRGVVMMAASFKGDTQSEAFIHDAALSRTISRYFCKEVIPNCGMTQQESLAYLMSLL